MKKDSKGYKEFNLFFCSILSGFFQRLTIYSIGRSSTCRKKVVTIISEALPTTVMYPCISKRKHARYIIQARQGITTLFQYSPYIGVTRTMCDTIGFRRVILATQRVALATLNAAFAFNPLRLTFSPKKSHSFYFTQFSHTFTLQPPSQTFVAQPLKLILNPRNTYDTLFYNKNKIRCSRMMYHLYFFQEIKFRTNVNLTLLSP